MSVGEYQRYRIRVRESRNESQLTYFRITSDDNPQTVNYNHTDNSMTTATLVCQILWKSFNLFVPEIKTVFVIKKENSQFVTYDDR